MGQMTLGEFRADVAEGIQRTGLEVSRPELVDRWIHNAMYEFGYVFKFRELETYDELILLAGERNIVKPDDFRMIHENGIEILGVENFEGKLLRETRDQFIKRNRTVGSWVTPGRPKWYHLFGALFMVRPTADLDYTLGIHYWRRITPLTDPATDRSIFGDDWDDIILTGAMYRGFRHFNEFDRYQNMKNDFIAGVRSRKFEEDLEEFPEGGMMPVTWKDRESDSTYGTPESETFGEIPP